MCRQVNGILKYRCSEKMSISPLTHTKMSYHDTVVGKEHGFLHNIPLNWGDMETVRCLFDNNLNGHKFMCDGAGIDDMSQERQRTFEKGELA